MLKFVAAAFLFAIASQSGAQQISNCERLARADAIVEPWEDNTRTYANGDVRLALIDTVEPAAGAYHVLVISPPFGEVGNRQCRTIGMSQGIGFSDVDFGSLTATYDPERGLTFKLDVQRFVPDAQGFLPAKLHFSVNQSTGFIGVDLQ